MLNEPYSQRIRERIFSFSPGTVFCIADLSDCGSYDAVRQTLSRMSKDILYLQRVVSGIYWLNPHNEKTPQATDVMNALVRNNNWFVFPGTELARYHLGLSKIEPSSITYLSTGPSGRYYYSENDYFTLQHCGWKYLTTVKPETALFVSAFWELNTHPVTAQEVMHLASSLSEDHKKILMEELNYIPVRLRCIAEIICGRYGKGLK